MQDSGQQGQADGACLPRQGGPHIHQYGAQGDHCQRCLHHQRSQSVNEKDEAEEASEKGGWFHPPLGQRTVLIVRDFMATKKKIEMIDHPTQSGDLQDQVRRGRRHPHQGRLHRLLRQVGGEALKVYSCCWIFC